MTKPEEIARSETLKLSVSVPLCSKIIFFLKKDKTVILSVKDFINSSYEGSVNILQPT